MCSSEAPSPEQTEPLRTGTGGRAFIGSLESIRGLAALAVAFFHSFLVLPVDGVRIYDRPLWELHSTDALLMRLIMVPFNGLAAVSLFFVLSGYVLSISLRRDERALVPKTLGFAGRRFLRIYPPLAVNLILMTAVSAVLVKIFTGIPLAQPTLEQLRTNLLLADFPVNGATWTLLIEIVAVPFIIVGWLLRRRFGIAGSFLFLVLCLIPSFTSRFTGRMMFGGYLFMFALGALVADLGESGIAPKRRKQAAFLCIAAAVLLFTARLLCGYRAKGSLRWEGIAAAILVLILAHGPRLAIHRFLETAPLRFLGRISYSFYLYHPMTLAITAAFLQARIPDSETAAHPFLWSAIIALASIPAAFLLGWAGYMFVEKPMVSVGRRI